MPSYSALAAVIMRGHIAESSHTVHIAETDATGELLASAGDPELVTTLRSSAKPLQAIPAITLPGTAELNMTDEEVAICCASHPGEPRHAALAASVLALSGFLPDDLVCGSAGSPPSPLRHGCSGNHAAILLAAHLLRAPLDGYYLPDHPAEREILRVMRELCGAEPGVAVDGCGVPTFGLPLYAMARGFANLARPGASWERIPRAMGAHPELVGDLAWADVRLMQVTRGRLIAKTGAEGLLCLGMPGHSRGLAIKALDGNMRAVGPAAIEWLLHRGWITDQEADDDRLAELRYPVFTDPCGRVTGGIRIVAEWAK